MERSLKSLEFFFFSTIDQVTLSILRNVPPPSHLGDSSVNGFINIRREKQQGTSSYIMDNQNQEMRNTPLEDSASREPQGYEVNNCSSVHFPSLCLNEDLGDSIKRRWQEMEIQTHEGDGGNQKKERHQCGLASHW